MSKDEMEDRLRALNTLETPAPSAAARHRALAAAMTAFDAAQKESTTAPQGAPWGRRLTSIVQSLRKTWIMDTRYSVGLGTAAVALLLLPLGYQLYMSTSFTPPGIESRGPVDAGLTEDTAPPVAQPEAKPAPILAQEESADLEASAMDDAAANIASTTSGAAPTLQTHQLTAEPAPAPVSASPGRTAGERATLAPRPALTSGEVSNKAAAASALPQTESLGDRFESFAESPLKVTASEPVSTFSIDVDTASYAYVRRMLSEGYVPPPDAVRIEEMINYFDYDYPGPGSDETPFRADLEVVPAPWSADTRLVRIGVKGYAPPAEARPAANLVLLIDTSGSMEGRDRLPLVKRAFVMMLDQLGPGDTVSIVTYSGSAGVALEPTQASEKAKILGALETLSPGGSTAGAQGIELAYQLASEHMIEDGINRVILATDGDFNVGISDPDALETFIKRKRDEGISLSVIGVGQGNYTDTTMQALAQTGNGNASYLDSFQEARKVLAAELGSTLQTIAQDVKVQVEFNPAVVSEYRLIGYETRALNREDFNNDKVDAGDIGAGHTVTALYEITPVGSTSQLVDPLRYGERTAAVADRPEEIGFVKIRYKLPGETASRLIETPIARDLVSPTLDEASEDTRWAAAVAAFGQKLKGSDYGGNMSYEEIRALAQGARGDDEHGYRAGFIQLVDTARLVAQGR